MRKDTDEHIDKIIQDLAGELTSAESADLANWIASHPDHQVLHDEITKVWAASDVPQTPVFDSHTDWTFLQEQMGEESASIAPPDNIREMPRRSWGVWVAAAALALLVGLGIAKFGGSGLGEPTLQVASTQEVSQSYTLADGSVVLLNRASSLTYPQQFAETERHVQLSGEAFFDVATQSSPFIIETAHSRIEVTGTSFNVRSYSEGNMEEVSVSSGQVSISQRDQADSPIVLNMGDQGVIPVDGSTIQVERADANDFSWKTSVLVFADTPLDEVVEAISRHYSVTIQLKTVDLEQLRYTGRFSQTELVTVLETVALAIGLNLNKQSQGYQLSHM